MKITCHEEVVEAVKEIFELKNWTDLTLRELAYAGRIAATDSVLEGWVKHYYAENEMIFGGFFPSCVIETLKLEIKKLD